MILQSCPENRHAALVGAGLGDGTRWELFFMVWWIKGHRITVRSFCGRFNSYLCFLCHVDVTFIDRDSESAVPLNRKCPVMGQKGLPLSCHVEPRVGPSPPQPSLPLCPPAPGLTSTASQLPEGDPGKSGAPILCGWSSLTTGILAAWALTAADASHAQKIPGRTQGPVFLGKDL